jgi:hypothetical protein
MQHLRTVRLYAAGKLFTLDLWDTGRTESAYWTQRRVLGYRLSGADGIIFEGEDFRPSPLSAPEDVEECLRTILLFLTLRPGDTDAEYFADYTPRQMAFVETYAEELSLYAHDCETALA